MSPAVAVQTAPVAAVRSIRDIPHLCSCAWSGPDYRLPPRRRRYALSQPDQACAFHRHAPAPAPAATARIPVLGPVQIPALEALADAWSGLTIADVAALLEIPRASADSAVRLLERSGCARIAGHQKRAGRAAAVYVASTAGLAALKAARTAGGGR